MPRCVALNDLLCEQNFPSIAIHRGMSQDERLAHYKQFKDFQKRILVATNLFGRGMDIERVNIVFNYDMPEDTNTYLHRVARAGRFGTKGLAITFVSSDDDAGLYACHKHFLHCQGGYQEQGWKNAFLTRMIQTACFFLWKNSFFRSRKKFSTTYAIVLFFFSPDLFMKISNFSKTVHTIFTKFCTVILHPKRPQRVQRHQNRMAWM